MIAPAEQTMPNVSAITCVFLDISRVLLTDGWDHHARKRAAMKFTLGVAQMEERHHLIAVSILRAHLPQQLEGKPVEHKQYINKYGDDMPEIRHWKWGSPP